MIRFENTEIFEQTKLIEEAYKTQSASSLPFEKFIRHTLNKLYGSKPFQPYEVRLPKSLPELFDKDFSPSRILKINSRIMSSDGSFPIWEGRSDKEVFLRGLGYRNGDSRYFSNVYVGGLDVHAFLAGATGHGKSVAMNSLIGSAALEYAPWELKITLIDPKITEFKKYAGENILPHIATIAATSDTDYVISVLEDLLQEMKNWNNIFGSVGVSGIAAFREKYNLAIPRNIIFFDEVQTAFVEAKRKSARLAELIDLIGRLGRSAGYHIVMASQEPDAIPDSTMGNVKVRISLGVQFEKTSKKILNNSEATSLYGQMGRAIANTDTSTESTKNNQHFRVPFPSDGYMESFRKDVSKIGKDVGFRHQFNFYDESDVEREPDFFNNVVPLVKDHTKIYLGAPSFLLKSGSINRLILNLDGSDIQNIVVGCPTPAGTNRYMKMLKANIKAMGNKVINNFLVCSKSDYDELGLEELGGSLVECRDFLNSELQFRLNAVLIRIMYLDVESRAYRDPKTSEHSEAVFNAQYLRSPKDTSINRVRCYHFLELLKDPAFNFIIGGVQFNPKDTSNFDTAALQPFVEFIRYLEAMGRLESQLVKSDLKPIFNWMPRIDKMIGLGRDFKQNNENKIKKVLQDANLANVTFICSTTTGENISNILKNGFRYYIMEGLDDMKCKAFGADDYPDQVAPQLGVLYDKMSDGVREAVKFKKMAYVGETFTA